MKFASEGATVAAIAAAVAVAAGAALGWPAFVVGAVVATGVLLFFRDPERYPPTEGDAIISPADGRVVAVEENATPHRFAPEATSRITIFMSPLDVHINRSPAAGVVERVEHRPGKFAAAYRAEASEINESNSLLLRTSSGARIVVVQIAGWLARRIICHVRPGAELATGQRFGLIMFGSRVDVFLPPGTRLMVRVGEKVRSGETLIAQLVQGAANETQAA
ncbi:MAG TPA: phosphatidylserine decarboxylase family protein [Candidatus Limnocylindrales bacterium]|nr:phosphatidylserine decarboxylase family protein [Candidatus Limnocylindrales bacterium]